MKNKVRKAVIPVAGLGTRFLPATKAQPKEMLTLVDKPIIQYIVEEAVAAGIEEIIFVTSANKRAIEDHFDRTFELEYRLKQKDKKKELANISRISDLATFVYIRQKTPLGLGHAIATAAPLIGDEPFAVLLGDDIIDSQVPALKQLLHVYDKYEDVVLGAIKVDRENISRYGVLSTKRLENNTHQVFELVEKPSPTEAPSDLAIIGRYIMTPAIMEILKTTAPGINGEIQLTDALVALQKSKPIYAQEIDGQYFDCGDKLDFLRATVNYGLKHEDLHKGLKKYLDSIQ
ncbi:MAG: UTP--glucose-1-phosphate uridylyltransferase GalU [Candidatus Komeilibacteria bacterium]|nr:UTP--glucose-1-phosphate uridylyltransferase GalU [Candidatus Komeilibacteria bacterium]